MAKTTKKELSKCMSGHLDELGFDRTRIWERIHVSNKSSRAKDISTKKILKTENIEKIFVGSIREGIGLYFLNDTDILQINHGTVCINHWQNVDVSGKVVFQMIQKKAPAGYTFLKLASKETSSETFEHIRYALVKNRRGKFLSSQLFMTKNDDVFKTGKGFISKNTKYEFPKGPSIPKYVEDDLLKKFLSELNLTDSKMDYVRAFPCNADSILDAWNKRDRQSGWPSKKTIAHVMTLPAYVVPVGLKGSTSEDLQWRISLIMAEIHLIQSLNNTQTKVFVLMKLIAKHILKPVSPNITSYVVKMVMLWLAEKIPQKKFRRKHLIARLNDALNYLKTAVETRCLPCYLIPKRNLFADKFQNSQHQKKVIIKLNLLLQNGSKMIMDFFNNQHPLDHEIMEVFETIQVANYIDKIQTCQMALFTTQQLADYFSRMFFASTWWYYFLYNIVFHLGPYRLAYGFSDPMKFKLSHKLAESEKKELAFQKKKATPTLAVAMPNDRKYTEVGLACNIVKLYSAILFLFAYIKVLLTLF